mgnify:CR=1 FL=1
MKLINSVLAVVALMLFFLTPTASAIDAGDFLRDAQLPVLIDDDEADYITSVRPIPSSERTGPFFAVSKIALQGVTKFPKNSLDFILREAIGESIAISDLQSVAKFLDQYYLDHGFLAKTSIPEQDIVDGIITLLVSESKLGKISINSPKEGLRFNDGYAKEILGVGQDDGISITSLEKSVRVLTNMPGIEARISLAPGVKKHHTDVNVNMKNTKLITGFAQVDNRGSQSTGKNRIVSMLTGNGAFSMGDKVAGYLSKSKGSDIYQLNGSVPLGNVGDRASASLTRLDYKLVNNPSTPANGYSNSATVQYSTKEYLMPELHSVDSIELGYNKSVNYTSGVESSNKTIDSIVLSSAGYVLDKDIYVLGGGSTQYQLSTIFGNADLSKNASDLLSDSTTKKVDGTFKKLNFSLDRNDPIGSGRVFKAQVKGQLGFDNLDSSQKMSLGGANGVRAYPIGEAPGDSALLLQAEVQQLINKNMVFSVFADAGWVELNNTLWSGWQSGNSTLENQYWIKGAGISINGSIEKDMPFKAVWAHTIGGNSGRDSNGNNADGYQDKQQLWLELSSRF